MIPRNEVAMMTLREQLTHMQAKLRYATQDARDASGRQMDLDAELQELLAQIVKQDRLLTQTTWSVSNNNGYLFLSADEEMQDPVLEIAKGDWDRISLDLTKQVRLTYNDGCYSLCFYEPGQIAPFVKEYELTISASDLDEELASLKQKVKDLEALRITIGV